MWTLLETAADLDRYRAGRASGFGRDGPFRWGAVPEAYPCLVCSIMPPPPPGAEAVVASAYVYPADAEVLLAARPAARPALAGATGATQDQFNRWSAAQLLACIDFLIGIKICTEEQFEETLLEKLELVDGYRRGRNAPVGAAAAGGLVRLFGESA